MIAYFNASPGRKPMLPETSQPSRLDNPTEHRWMDRWMDDDGLGTQMHDPLCVNERSNPIHSYPSCLFLHQKKKKSGLCEGFIPMESSDAKGSIPVGCRDYFLNSQLSLPPSLPRKVVTWCPLLEAPLSFLPLFRMVPNPVHSKHKTRCALRL